MKIFTPLPPTPCLAADIADAGTAAETASVAANETPSAALAVDREAITSRTIVSPSTSTSHTALRGGGIAVHGSITARRGRTKSSGVQTKQRDERETTRCPRLEAAIAPVEDSEADMSGPHSVEGFELKLMEAGIPPTAFNRRIYQRALMIEGREIALGLGGVLVDHTGESWAPHRLLQRAYLKTGAEALLLGLQRGNKLSLYTHEPAIRVARLLEAFPTLGKIFFDARVSDAVSEKIVRKSHRIICLEDQLESLNHILQKVRDKSTLLDWESGLLQTLRAGDIDLVRLANLRSRALAASARKAHFDVVVSVERTAWRPQLESGGAAMILMPGRIGNRSDIIQDDTLLQLLMALEETNIRGSVSYVNMGSEIEGEEAREATVELPARHFSPAIGEFMKRLMELGYIKTRYSHIKDTGR
jgi:hypothetical protein